MTPDPTLAAIEQRVQRVLNMDGHPSAQVRQDARRLALDVQGLLDRLRAVTAERDQAEARFRRQAGQTALARIDRDHARDQVAAVRALPRTNDATDWAKGYNRALADVLRALDSAQPQDTTPEASDSPRQWTEGDTLRETAHMMMESWPMLIAQRADALTRIARDAFRTYDEVYGPTPATPQDTPDPHDGHPYAYVDDCPDCEAARWPSTPQP